MLVNREQCFSKSKKYPGLQSRQINGISDNTLLLGPERRGILDLEEVSILALLT